MTIVEVPTTVKDVGYRHSSDEILAAAVAVSLEAGIAAVTFNRVGERLGISDRTVVYYFPTKADLITSVALAIVADLEALLERAFGSQRRSQADLLKLAWPVITTADADRVFALYFEIVGLASTGQAPYVDLARGLVHGFVQWITPRQLGSTPAVRRRRALAAVAQIDGLLLMRQILGPEAADLAAHESGANRRETVQQVD